MGKAWSKFVQKIFVKNNMRVLLLGLDAAGKTTILHQLKGKPKQTVPTVGFNVETIKFDKLQFVVWDISGAETLRPYWRHYYRGTSGVIFVIDSADSDRFDQAKAELHGLMKEEELENSVLLVLANKQDLKESLSTDELWEELELDAINDREVTIKPCVASEGRGLDGSLRWLADTMKPLTVEKGKNKKT